MNNQQGLQMSWFDRMNVLRKIALLNAVNGSLSDGQAGRNGSICGAEL
jgi:hypothetical protein